MKCACLTEKSTNHRQGSCQALKHVFYCAVKLIKPAKYTFHDINNGNRTEWSPIQSVTIRVITKLDDREAGVQFVNHEY